MHLLCGFLLCCTFDVDCKLENARMSFHRYTTMPHLAFHIQCNLCFFLILVGCCRFINALNLREHQRAIICVYGCIFFYMNWSLRKKKNEIKRNIHYLWIKSRWFGCWHFWKIVRKRRIQWCVCVFERAREREREKMI